REKSSPMLATRTRSLLALSFTPIRTVQFRLASPHKIKRLAMWSHWVREEARERRMIGRIDPLLVEGGEW
ncbi:unnamed protein product, partial [Dovyalis caffra]